MMLSPIGTLRGGIPLVMVSIAFLASLGVPSAEGLVPRNFRSMEDTPPSDEFAVEPEAEPTLDLGYSFVPEGYPMDQGSDGLSEADLGDGVQDSRSKRERCYCDLDLFCKRFGCRRRKRVSARSMRTQERPAFRKSDLLLQLARRLQQARNFKSLNSE